MKLTDLNPKWLRSGGYGIQEPSDDPCKTCGGSKCDVCHGTGREYRPATPREGIGVSFDCPCGNKDEDHRVHIIFSNPLDGKPVWEDGDWRPTGRGWRRAGDTFETLDLTPSILRTHTTCSWHGFVRNGEIQTV